MARGRPSRATVYARLEGAIAELNERLGGLPSPKEAEFIWSDIWHLEAHHSTALEGNTLVLREVEALLERGRAVGAKPLKEYMEVQGYGAAARWVYGQALEPGDWHTGDLVNMYEVRQAHERAMSPVWEVAPHPEASPQEGPGSFREHDIQPFDGGMVPPSWPLVPAAVNEWVDFVNAHAVELGSRDVSVPWPERLSEVHNKFEQSHPFIDGAPGAIGFPGEQGVQPRRSATGCPARTARRCARCGRYLAEFPSCGDDVQEEQEQPAAFAVKSGR